MQKKGAIELSMTTIIVIVIGITLLVLGLTFVTNIFKRTADLAKKAFEISDKELQDRMTATQRMYIPQFDVELEPGASTTITVGIKNFGEEETPSAFKVDIVPSEDGKKEWFTLPPTLSLRPGEVKGFPLKVNLPDNALPGKSYAFTVASYKENELWDQEAMIISVAES